MDTRSISYSLGLRPISFYLAGGIVRSRFKFTFCAKGALPKRRGRRGGITKYGSSKKKEEGEVEIDSP